MQCTLSFSQGEKKRVRGFLESFPEGETKTEFEEKRCKIRESTVTLYRNGRLVVQGKGCESVKERILEAAGLEKEAVLGIDEAGRGEGRGPFVVAAVLADASKMREVRDSKKTRDIEKAREKVERNAVDAGVFVVSSQELNALRKQGKTLNEIEARAINSLVKRIKPGRGVRVLADGKRIKGVGENVEFLEKADDRNGVVAAASILARSERDRSKDRGKRENWGKRDDRKGEGV